MLPCCLLQGIMTTKVCMNANCMATGVGFKACCKCKLAYYCSKECQTDHWKAVHKKECGGMIYRASGYDPKRALNAWLHSKENNVRVAAVKALVVENDRSRSHALVMWLRQDADVEGRSFR